jgi:uncharacterized membrane protein
MKKLLTFILISTFVLAGCTEVDLSDDPSSSQPSSKSTSVSTASASSNTASFRGEKGKFIALKNNEITVKASSVDDGKAHYFNTTLPDGNPVYFFIVKSPDGKLRAAANGCQVCGDALQGFRQEGDYMVCNTCGNKYPLNKIATEKGGCNPVPINPDLKVNGGNVSIPLSDLKSIRSFFE